MHHFKDTANDSWAVAVSYGDVLKVQRDCDGFHLPSMFSDDLAGLARLSEDSGLTVAVAFCLCERQADERNIDAGAFAYRMGGDTLDQAATAIVQATIDFFPDERRREALRELVAKVRKTSSKMLESLAPAGLAKLDEAIEAITNEQLATLSMTSFGNAAASSASSPGDSASAS
jgi:hypothetical protein